MEDRLINFEFEELWYLFKKKFWIIIVITVITTSLAVLKVSKLQPSYSASAKVFMGNGNDMLLQGLKLLLIVNKNYQIMMVSMV